MGKVNFLALYRGGSIADAHVVAVTCDPALVEIVTRFMLDDESHPTGDAALDALAEGRRCALRLIRGFHSE